MQKSTRHRSGPNILAALMYCVILALVLAVTPTANATIDTAPDIVVNYDVGMNADLNANTAPANITEATAIVAARDVGNLNANTTNANFTLTIAANANAAPTRNESEGSANTDTIAGGATTFANYSAGNSTGANTEVAQVASGTSPLAVASFNSPGVGINA